MQLLNFCLLEQDREMASALEELIGASVVDGSGKTVAVSSLAGNDKVLGQYRQMYYILVFYKTFGT